MVHRAERPGADRADNAGPGALTGVASGVESGAATLTGTMCLAQRVGTRLRAVTRMQALQRARTCYDHLAGEVGVALADRLLETGVLSADAGGTWSLSTEGARRLIELGLDGGLLTAGGRRPLVRVCPDWTERRPHVAGRLGAAICGFWLQTGLAHRLPGSRALRVTPAGNDWLARI